MMTSITETRASIRLIDRQIDCVRAAVEAKEAVDHSSVESWQRAWDRHPVLRDQERSLFRQRGEQQLVLALLESDAARGTARVAYRKPKKCPTCGHHTLAA